MVALNSTGNIRHGPGREVDMGGFVQIEKTAAKPPAQIGMFSVQVYSQNAFKYGGLEFKFSSVGKTATVTIQSEKDPKDSKQITLKQSTTTESPVDVAGYRVTIKHENGKTLLSLARKGAWGNLCDLCGGVLEVSYKFNFSERLPETEIKSKKAKIDIRVPDQTRR